MLPPEEGFAELLAQKEQEWKELQNRQVQFLEIALKDTKKSLQEQTEKFNKLKKDFTYNLKVLGERDRELEQYEIMFNHLKVVENSKQSEISDLKIQIEKLQQEIQREKKKHDELQSHYQRKLKEHQMDLERLQSSKNNDIDRHREEYEKIKRQLERKIEEVEGDLALQKQELLLEFDSEMKKREHEFRLHLDEMNTLVMSHELKVKILTKELDIIKEASLKASESLQEAETSNLKLQDEVQRKDWEMKDLSVVKDARIKSLEEKLKSLQRKKKIDEEAFQRKHEQLDRFAREKESALRAMQAAHGEQVQRMESQIEELQMEQRRTQRSHQDILAQRDAMIEKLKEDLDIVKTGWDSYITQVSKETVSKDLKTQALQEEEDRLRAQLDKYHKDIERYQQQVSCSLERERLLEQGKIQLELDWQKRLEETEKAQYQQSEELIDRLNKAKEQALAELKEKDRRLNELETLVSAVTGERDQVMDILCKQGIQLPQITGENHKFQNNFPSNEIQNLREQNAELRLVIGQMRKEMELLCEQISHTDPTHEEPPKTGTPRIKISSDYVQSLEDDIRNLKEKNKLLEEQLLTATKENHIRPLTQPVSTDSAYIQRHSHSLREATGARGLEAQADYPLNTVVRHLHEEIQTLRQQLAVSKSSGGVALLLNKLKEASKKISQLSSEKQQLIDLGNRLRAEQASAADNVPQNPAQLSSRSLTSKMEAQTVHNRLSALEDLQYKLTSQELQYAQYQPPTRLSSKGHLGFSAQNRSDSEDTGSANVQTLMPHYHLDDQKADRKENTPPRPSPRTMESARSLQPTSSWSQGDSSLQDVWKLLDMGSSPSIVSSLEDGQQAIIVRGKHVEKNKSKEPSSMNMASPSLKYQKEETTRPSTMKKSKPRSTQNTPNIRNYNIRD
ncbi:coiled-coil domain-containing protein 57 isoform 2-T2 [Discoglossus pictus]